MFVSGTTYHLLQLGQPLDDGPSALFIDPTAQTAVAQPQQEGKRKLSVSVKPSTSNHSTGSPAGSTKAGGSKGGPSLADLIEAGMLQPGDDNMKVTYKGSTYAGALQSNGTILFRGTTFNTPSAFSVHVKRIITPGKQGDDGWHSVYVDGVLLNAIRQQYHAKMLGQPYKQSSNKTPRRNQSSPRQQQQQALSQQQQQQPAQPQQQQQPGQRPPLPMPKLKLGNIKGLPQQHSSQQQQEPQRVLQPAQQQDPGQGQAQQPKPKLKFKMPLKLTGSSAAGGLGSGAQQQVAAGAAAGAGAGVGVHQALAAPVVLQCPVDPHQPMLQEEAPVQQHPPGQGAPKWVRCCRCEQWRCVPDGSWPQVEAVGSNWFCEDAGWDLKQQQPFTDACMPDVWADTPDEGLMVPAL